MRKISAVHEEPSDFSLVQGGPLYRLFVRCRLLRPPLAFLGRRLVLLVAITWVPLALLSALEGTLHKGVAVPFLHQLAVHARFLGSLPLLVIADLLVQERLVPIIREFQARGIVPPESRPRFLDIIASSRRLRDAIVPEVVLVLLAFTVSHWFWSQRVALPVDTWYGHVSEGHRTLSGAGWWYAFVSLPILRFLLYRWYFRLAIWYSFLWRVARLPLNLNPLHPDRAGGLGFLSESILGFAPLLVAHTVTLAGFIGDNILHLGSALTSFKIEIAAVVALLLLLVLLPLTFFALRLGRLRRAMLRDYGGLALRYVDDFRQRWIEHPESHTPPLLGTPDIQSLSDLGNSFNVPHTTKLAPISKRAVVALGALIVFPLLPLVLTVIPVEELLTRLMKLVV